MIKKVHYGTVRVFRSEFARLSWDLVVGEYVTIDADPKAEFIYLRRASEKTKGRVQLSHFHNRRSPMFWFRRALKLLNLTPFEAAGIYRAKLRGDTVVIDMRRRYGVEDGSMVPQDYRAWNTPYLPGSLIQKALDMCIRGTTIRRLRTWARRHELDVDRVVREMLSKEKHGCRVEHRGDCIKLHPPN
jgi:hypothetical protein